MYLEGTQIKISTAKEMRRHIGKRVKYLLKRDIDKTGRGYFLPRNGTIEDVHGKNINFGNENYIYFSEIQEIVEL